ncbi:NADH dehydrogenase [ubiquinone] 1 alpha subcomplex subunit 9, mitochondrial [Sitophilus oryzae]|uniref:NADH dehydrogenase [ubiquinone] 1 alpha subcomplex subunit 9, mitochondrial n=1 Tax=Sitophilus oryzae TaxID=7048 RepID=A0A6J2XV96_SITOR|nr:NADH dehydrogenase [ubiquinone] 1 alpha subcomplex subunit 9, mitochondrial [Sitophilus oryzae]
MNKSILLTSLKPHKFIAVSFQVRGLSTENDYTNLAAYKRGTGGRSSFNGVVATVFGSTGFVGRYVCNKLGKIGTQLILPYRGDNYDPMRLKLCGDLGQVFFQHYNLKDEESIRKAIKYSNVVINLVGREWETRNYKFNDVHVDGARRLARLAREAGVERFIHVSALNATEHPKSVVLKGGSRFLSSKYLGEKAVLEEFPNATIFRPSDIYGSEDRFVRYYAHHFRRNFHAIPLWFKGEKTIKQPVFVSDVAAGIVAAVKDPDTAGKIYQAVGPKKYLLSEIVDYFYRVMRRDQDPGYLRYDMRWDPLFQLRVTLCGRFSVGWPIANLHWEKIEREHVSDSVESDIPTLEDLGVALTELENQIPWELKPYTAALYHGFDSEEPFPTPAPPKVLL